MLLVKGLLICLPFFLFRLPVLASLKDRRIISMSCLSILLIMVISPFSFAGWLLDYLAISIASTMILASLMTGSGRTLVILMRSFAVLICLGYIIVNALFGPKQIQQYSKEGLTYRLYEIPDLVIWPTHRLKIDQTWGPFEKNLFEDRVVRGRCTIFDYNVRAKKLFQRDTCE